MKRFLIIADHVRIAERLHLDAHGLTRKLSLRLEQKLQSLSRQNHIAAAGTHDPPGGGLNNY